MDKVPEWLLAWAVRSRGQPGRTFHSVSSGLGEVSFGAAHRPTDFPVAFECTIHDALA